MSNLTPNQARELRLKRAKLFGDIADAQIEIDAINIELGETAAPAPAPVTPPAPAPVTPPVSTVAPLPSIEGSMVLWDFGRPWAQAEWEKGGGIHNWKAANAVLKNGEITLSIANGAAGSVQKCGDMYQNALYEVDATLPKGVEGSILAPLYLFGDYRITNDEIDFEVVGTKGMQLAIHAGGRMGVFSKNIPGDFTGKHRFAIRYDAGKEVIWYIDGKEVARATPADCKDGIFPTHPLRTHCEIWASTSVEWAGRWNEASAPMHMVIHGYRRT